MIDIILSHWTLIAFHAYPECINIPSQLPTDSILQHFHHLQLVFYWTLGLRIGSAVADENQNHSLGICSRLWTYPTTFCTLSPLSFFCISFYRASILRSKAFSPLHTDQWTAEPFPQLSQCAAHTFVSQLTNNGFFSKYLFNPLLTLFSSAFFSSFYFVICWSSLRWAELRRSVLLLALFQT